MDVYIYTMDMYIYIYYNVKVGLINPPINQPPLHMFFCNLKTGGPPGLINRLAWND